MRYLWAHPQLNNSNCGKENGLEGSVTSNGDGVQEEKGRK